MKKWMAGVLAAVLCLQGGLSQSVFAQAKTLTLEGACNMAIDESYDIQMVNMNMAQKRIELKQALDGIQDTRKKESTIRFSLLLNIKFPEKHGMPKEIELLTKVPKIENEIKVLQKQVQHEKLAAQTKAEQAYYDVLDKAHGMSVTAMRIAEYKSLLKQVEAQYRMGNGKKTDVEYVENQLRAYENAQQKNITADNTAKRKLSRIINRDVELGYTFQEAFVRLNVNRNELDGLIDFAMKNDFELMRVIEKRKTAEKALDTIMGIYKNRYGSLVQSIENYIQSHEGKNINYDDFVLQYNQVLVNIDSKWDGSYSIPLIFFVLKIPKEWFKGEYDGTRYMEDQKYAIFVSLVERDKARKEEKEAIAALEEKIRDGYGTLKSLEISISAAEESLSVAKTNLQHMLRDNKLGLLDFVTVESAKADVYEKEQALYAMNVEYVKQVSAFNLLTAGYVNHQLNRFTPPAEESFEGAKSQLEGASWYVKNNLTDFNFTFGVNIPQDYQLQYYQLFYNGMPVGGKVDVQEELVHAAITYEDTQALEVRFFQGQSHVYSAQIVGDGFSGPLNLFAVTANQGGTWQLLPVDGLREKLVLSVDESFDYDTAILKSGDVVIGTIQKGETFTTLNVYFHPVENLFLQLQKDGQTTATLLFVVDGEGNGLLKKEGGAGVA